MKIIFFFSIFVQNDFMKTIQIKKIIEDSKCSLSEIAVKLFPANAHPEKALRRVMSSDAVLDANQICVLSSLTGIPINELFEGGEWRGRTQNNLHIFKNGEFEAELNIDTWVTKIYKNGSLYNELVLASKTCTLSEYINKLNQIIYEN